MTRILNMHYELMKDQTKKLKHTISVRFTDTDKKLTLNAVAELPKGSVLLNELEAMMKDMEDQHEAAEKARSAKKKGKVSSPEKAVV